MRLSARGGSAFGMTSLALAMTLTLLVIFPLVALAQDQPLPATGFEKICSRTLGLAVCVQQLYLFALGFGALIALLMIVLAGYRYMTASGNAQQVQNAKDAFSSAFIGLIIIFIAFILLYLINPDLTRFKNFQDILKLPEIKKPNPANLPGNILGGGGNQPPVVLLPPGVNPNRVLRAMDLVALGAFASDPDPGQSLTYEWEITSDPTGKGEFVNKGINSTGFGVRLNTAGTGQVIVVRCYVSDGVVTGIARPFIQYNITVLGLNNPPVAVIKGHLGSPTNRVVTGGGVSPDASDSYDPDGNDVFSFEWFIDGKSGGSYCGVLFATGMNGADPSISVPEMTANIDQNLRLEMGNGLHKVVKIVTAYLSPDDTPCT